MDKRISQNKGGRGRRKTDEEKKADGTYRPDRAAPPPPDYGDGEVVVADDLTEGQRKHYDLAVSILKKGRVLTLADYWAVREYAVICDRRDEQIERGRTEPATVYDAKGNPKINPFWTQYNKDLDRMFKFWNDFGFTPVARARVGGAVQGEGDDKKESDPLDALDRI